MADSLISGLLRAIMSAEQPPISKGGILWDRFHLLPALDAVWVAKSPSPILEMIFFNAFPFLLCMYVLGDRAENKELWKAWKDS